LPTDNAILAWLACLLNKVCYQAHKLRPKKFYSIDAGEGCKSISTI
jgi:hypothetical protein